MKSINESQLIEQSKQAKTLVVDARTPAEYRLKHITGATNLPLDQFPDHVDILKQYDHVIVYCNSGNTSSQFIRRAEQAGLNYCINLTGGISSCKSCPITTTKGPLPIMRQVQITAGSLVLVGVILSLLLSQGWIALSTFVGAGLVFAGISGRCGMAKLLTMMPWNRDTNTQVRHHIITGKDVIIKQFEDSNLAHYSYVMISNRQAIIVDPERNPQKYYDFIDSYHATLVGIFNTHPHADFASGHLQMHEDTGATIYVGDKVGAEYPHIPLQGGEVITFGSASIIVYFTPGHSPDSMSYLIQDADNKQIGLCTGDWVFIGDVGRADLRESVGNLKASQAELAAQMYDTTRTILPTLDQSLILLPAHGAGTSCGKGLSKMSMDTLANQMRYNPMLQDMNKEIFVTELTSDQPSIPAYFTHSVLINKVGNISVSEAMDRVTILDQLPHKQDFIMVDTRARATAANYPLSQYSIIIPHQNKGFVGTLGAMIAGDERYILIVETHADKAAVLQDILSIGYEDNLEGIYVIEDHGNREVTIHHSDLNDSNTILDVRSAAAHIANPYSSSHMINIPLEQLSSRYAELDKTTTYIPYCGGSYKSNIALSWLFAHGYQVRKMSI